MSSTELMQQAEAIASLPQDLAILRIENDSIMSLAKTTPLDYVKVKAHLEMTLSAFPVLAEEAIYNKPVGRENDTCADCGAEVFRQKGRKAANCFKCKSPNVKDGEMKFARDLSVRAAETLADAVGFNKVRAHSKVVSETLSEVSASFTNYRNGRVWEYTRPVSRQQKRRDGAMYLVEEDRFLNVVLQAEQSKAIREVITRSLDAGLKAWFFDRCEKIQEGLLTDEQVAKIVGNFATAGVTQEQLEFLLGRSMASGWTTKDRLTLAGVWTSLKNKETTIDELLNAAQESAEPEKVKWAEGPVTGELLQGHTTEPTKQVENTTTEKPSAEAEPKLEPHTPATGTAPPTAQSTTDASKATDGQTVDEDPDALEGLADAFSVCEKIGDVHKVFGDYSKTKLSQRQHDTLAMARDTAIERIRSERPAKKSGSLLPEDQK